MFSKISNVTIVQDYYSPEKKSKETYLYELDYVVPTAEKMNVPNYFSNVEKELTTGILCGKPNCIRVTASTFGGIFCEIKLPNSTERVSCQIDLIEMGEVILHETKFIWHTDDTYQYFLCQMTKWNKADTIKIRLKIGFLTESFLRMHEAGPPSTYYLKKYFLNPEMSDVIIQCGIKDFPAHRIVLSSQSSVFEKMFQAPLEEGILEINDLNSKAFQEFLYFLYNGRMSGEIGELVIDLLYAADKYDVQELKNICVIELLKQIKSNPENSLKILNDAVTLSIAPELKTVALRYKSAQELTDGTSAN